jgi:hypothetical protein
MLTLSARPPNAFKKSEIFLRKLETSPSRLSIHYYGRERFAPCETDGACSFARLEPKKSVRKEPVMDG